MARNRVCKKTRAGGLTPLRNGVTFRSVTTRNKPTEPSRDPSNLEKLALDFLWANGRSTAEAVREGLPADKPLADSTVRTLLRRLEEKGHITHVEVGRAYVYTAVEKPRNAAVRALRQIVDRFCGGSIEELVTGMVEQEVINPAELKELARKLERLNRR
ncbi:MAG: BlaI/MecI/CopY family transcriptional regulator [Bryobacteraceae bacterium]|nr:BlaI/MecI/CopY family transcriptional regulator [Bryobacteraceae bacterium]